MIQAYRFFMRAHEPMAGFVALELAGPEYWDVTADYVALLNRMHKGPGFTLRGPHLPPAQSASCPQDKRPSLDDEPVGRRLARRRQTASP